MKIDDAVMRPRIHAIAVTSEIGEFTDEIRTIFAELGRLFGPESLAGECSPPLDMFETDDAVEITVDLPGVDPGHLRVLGKGDAVLIAGEKPSRRVRGESSFHVVERGYGRFARVVRISIPCDIAKATATLVDGELRVSLPKLDDRRGRIHRIPVTQESVKPVEAASAGKAQEPIS